MQVAALATADNDRIYGCEAKLHTNRNMICLSMRGLGARPSAMRVSGLSANS